MPPTIITIANHSSRRPARTSTPPPVINLPNRHRPLPPNDGRKILPPTAGGANISHVGNENIRLAACYTKALSKRKGMRNSAAGRQAVLRHDLGGGELASLARV